jgi:hypothetical protein
MFSGRTDPKIQRYCSKECRYIALPEQNHIRNPKRKYHIKPEWDPMIQKTYQNITGKGEIKALAERLKIPRQILTYYARKKGWCQISLKNPPWSAEEDQALEHLARYCPETIARKMKKLGFNRSVSGIQIRMTRMRHIQNLNGMPAVSVAEILGVDSKFVTRKIQQGKLRATRRGTNAPRDEYWILPHNLRKYIIENVHEIDFRKLDKYYVTDLLANGNAM